MIFSVGLFLASTVVSTLMAVSPFRSLMRATYTPLILATILVVYLMKFDLRRVAKPLVGVLLIGDVWQVVTWDRIQAWPHWQFYGFMPHPNDIALAPILIPFVGWLPLVLVLLSASRNAWLGVATVGWFTRYRYLVLTCVGVMLVIVTYSGHLNTGPARLGHWVVAWSMFVDAPWFGMGPHTFFDYYASRIAGVSLPFGIPTDIAYIPWAHSLYLEQLAERGLVGLVAFLTPLALAYRKASQPVRTAIVAFLVMGVFDLTLLKPWVVGTYWALVCLSWQS